ncbi:hypothetical protein NIES208_11620 [[Limnothrix rosea] IAM M-220]|nr:hypothetical protein NIES208_11620 [[Limnothrix rosea] IAM M-220]
MTIAEDNLLTLKKISQNNQKICHTPRFSDSVGQPRILAQKQYSDKKKNLPELGGFFNEFSLMGVFSA